MRKAANKLQLCTASAAGETLDPNTVLGKIRDAGKEFQVCIAGLEDILEEPLKSKFSEVKTQINKMLAGLPETDKVPAAMASNDVLGRLLDVLSTAQMMISNLNETAKSTGKALASTKASMTDEVNKAIDAKITAGELIAKDKHETALNDARSAATTAARAAAVAELKLAGERRLQLSKAGIPAPSDEVLVGEEKDFNAKKELADKRVKELAPYKLPEDRVLTLAWNTDEKAYEDTLNLVKATFEAASKKAGGNGFINRPGSDEKQPQKTNRFTVC